MRVLIVDDNAMVAMALSRMLLGHWHECQVAYSMPDAADRLHDWKFDAVITDYDLGSGGTGKAVCELARAHKLPVVVVVVTGNDTVTREYVGAEVVAKPATIQEILAALRRAGAPC